MLCFLGQTIEAAIPETCLLYRRESESSLGPGAREKVSSEENSTPCKYIVGGNVSSTYIHTY